MKKILYIAIAIMVSVLLLLRAFRNYPAKSLI